MSSRSTTKSGSALIDASDHTSDELTTAEVAGRVEQPAETERETLTVEVDNTLVAIDSESTEAQPVPDLDTDSVDTDATNSLARQLEQIVESVSVVEELSRRAREVASTDLALYDALQASQQQYSERLGQACAIRDQAQDVHQRAFGHDAKNAAAPIVAEADRVVQAFTHLSDAWYRRACNFLDEHPDIQLLLAEREAQEQQARQAEARAARERRLQVLVAAFEEAVGCGVLHEARRILEAISREFPDQTLTTDQLRLNLEQRERKAKDDVARQALAACEEHQARGDLEGAVNQLEQVDVHGLSVEVSQDIFGRWSEACSRLAQTAAATLVRFAPAQGRGLIMYADPAYPNGLIVFSSLGMGPGFPQAKVVTDPAVLRRARPFREAAPLSVTSWTGFGGAPSSTPPLAPIRH